MLILLGSYYMYCLNLLVNFYLNVRYDGVSYFILGEKIKKLKKNPWCSNTVRSQIPVAFISTVPIVGNYDI